MGRAIPPAPTLFKEIGLGDALKLAVVYPWSVEMGWTRCFHSMLRLKHPENCEVEFFRGLGWCSARRHVHCFEQALAWKADVICVLGADQVYHDRDMLCKLIGHYREGHDVLSALVSMRGMISDQDALPFDTVGWRVIPDDNGNISFHDGLKKNQFERVRREHGELVRFHAGGSGVLMFPASALSKMQPPWVTEWPSWPTFDRKAAADSNFLTRLQTEAGLEMWMDTTIKVNHLHPFEIDDTFPQRFADWADGGGDVSICAYKPKMEMQAV